jgi:hypothetical protein
MLKKQELMAAAHRLDFTLFGRKNSPEFYRHFVSEFSF